MSARESTPGVDRAALVQRKARGGWATPAELVDRVVANTLAPVTSGQLVRVLDPACGDGRFLAAAARRLQAAGAVPILHGVDIDRAEVAAAQRSLGEWSAQVDCDDSLSRSWGSERFDIVLGNPPFLSQLATATTRGGASRHGGGPYADAAAEFLALAVDLADPAGGRVGLVLPQSILGSRDASDVRRRVASRARLVWSWWTPQRVFPDAQVTVCALVFERGAPVDGDGQAGRDRWTRVVTDALGVPALPELSVDGTLADRAGAHADFRDQYYGLVPAVGDDVDGPPLVTSGLVDAGRCYWGERPVRFARRLHDRPRVELSRLSAPMRRWADSRLVPKVLVANQTRVIEAVADRDGAWLPGVPLITLLPGTGVDVDAVAAVLTSPAASAWAWHRAAGTGLSARTLRLGPRLLAELPWPAGPLDEAVRDLRRHDIVGCGHRVQRAYGIAGDGDALLGWWIAGLSPSRVS